MPFTRVYEPKPGEVFYHYCSVETFKAICEGKKLRFGDINMMNDYHESKWGYRIFEEAATELLNDSTLQEKLPGMQEPFFDKIDEIIAPLQLQMHPVISSFSKEPDVLSQWRAYADDGRGFALGLRGELLKVMPITLLEVEYDRKKQIEEMKDALIDIYMRNIEDGGKYDRRFRLDCRLMGFWKLGFKNPAFAEEKEVRCVHSLDVRLSDGGPRLVDAGGCSGKTKVEGEKVNY